MKRYLILLFCATIISVPLFSQEWAPTGAKWYYSHYYGSFQELTYIESVGEQMIQEIPCRKLNTWLVYRNWTPDSIYYDTNFLSTDYYYLEDDKIYHYDTLLNIFNKLYDFSLVPGDSVIVRDTAFTGCDNHYPYPYYCASFKYKIDSVDEMTIDESVHKIQYTSRISDADWSFNGFNDEIYPVIEQIGSLKFLLGSSISGTLEGDISWLRCYEDGNTFYRSPFWPDDKPCDYLSPIVYPGTSENDLKDFISVSPNPCIDFVSVLGPENTDMNEYKIMNSNGITVQSGSLKKDLNIDVSRLNPGVYAILLNINNTIITKKVLKK